MAKEVEHTAWSRINRRLGPAILDGGERERPHYIGEVIDLRGRAKSGAVSTKKRKGGKKARSKGPKH